MMRHRLTMLGRGADEQVVQGSALDIPFGDGSFDFVYTIGCLHHTGNLPRAVTEVRRVLAEGGYAVVMLYHAGSARQWLHVRLPAAVGRLRGRRGPSHDEVIKMYDADSAGEAAPHTDFVSRAEVRRLFSDYREVKIDTHNYDDIRLRRRLLVPRMKVLGSPLERWWGLDLYIVARR
jgi:SAM-dependent methyltransferase